MATLYDANGNPVDFRLLKKELAAPSLTSVRQIVAEHPSTGLTPEKLGRLLRVSEHGDPLAYLALAQDMEEKDLNYRAQLQTRKLACAGLPLVVEAASDSAEDQADADLVREVISQEGVEDILTDILDALGKGFSVCEILWDTQGKLWIPKGIPWRPTSSSSTDPSSRAASPSGAAWRGPRPGPIFSAATFSRIGWGSASCLGSPSEWGSIPTGSMRTRSRSCAAPCANWARTPPP
jgi:phage gp29-like protein